MVNNLTLIYLLANIKLNYKFKLTRKLFIILGGFIDKIEFRRERLHDKLNLSRIEPDSH